MLKKDLLGGFFEKYLNQGSIFLDKKVLQANYTPDTITHRDEEIKQIANILAPALRLEKPSNLFIYGNTGTGKTLSIIYTTNKILDVAKEKDIPIKVFYVNCKLKRIADTEYRLIAELSRYLGKNIPATGLPTDEVYKFFYSSIDEKKQLVVLILDEIDQLVKRAGDEILYNLTRINAELKNGQITLIGISNDLTFTDNLDARVKSSLSEEEINFPTYNALQIQDILRTRAKFAFKENILDQGVIEKCAAYAAREHGDARRALELLRVAGEIAERESSNIVTMKHIDDADEKIERDRVTDIVTTQPKQFQVTLYSICSFYLAEKKSIVFTGDVYDLYKDLCNKVGLRPLTQRRVSDIIAELDMLGIINARVVSKGRYGRTREISIGIPDSNIPKLMDVLKSALDL